MAEATLSLYRPAGSCNDRYLDNERDITPWMARTQEQRRAETRQQLLEAARDMVAERGIAGASVDAVAEAANLTSGALYGQFGRKEGLLVALLDAWKDATASVIAADFEASSSTEEQLASLWNNLADPPTEGDAAWALLE